MGRIADEDVERVRDATDIVSLVSESVQLKQKGRLFWGCCPFHAEKTPSFKVDPASGLWHCFGCGLGGDAIGFVMRVDHMEFPDAVRRLAERAHIEIHEESGGLPTGLKERLLAASDEAAGFYHLLLTTSRDRGPAEARDYLKSRGFGIDVAKSFRLGYAPSSGSPLTAHLRGKGFTSDELVTAGLAMADDRGNLRDRFFNRLMFPINDIQGRAIAFGGRVLGEGRPKYLNSAETPIFHKSANLYAIDKAKNEIVRASTAIVVEGYTDVIALHASGLPHTVATLGTALTEQHVKLLARFAKRVVYLFDGDDAGMRAAKRAEEFLGMQARPEVMEGKLELTVALIPEGMDPAEYVSAHGAASLETLVAEAAPLLRFLVDQRLAEHDLATPEGRSAALRSASTVIAQVSDSLLVHDYVNLLAGRLVVDYATVQQAVLAAAKSRRRSGGRPAEQAAGESSPTDRSEEAAQASDPERLAGMELLAVLARTPKLRPEARELLGSDAVVDQKRRGLMEAMVSAGDLVGHELFEAVTKGEPSLAEAASAAITGEPGAVDDEEYFEQLVASLKGFARERQIIRLQAELASVERVKDKARYDDLCLEIAKLLETRPDVVRTQGRRAADTDMEA